MSDTKEFVVRLPKDSTFALSHDAVRLLGERTEASLVELLSEPKHFLSRLDSEGHDLLLHSITKKLDPDSQWRIIDRLFELPPFYRTIQDSDRNSVLHYLAQKGVDVLRHGTVADFVYKNKFGNTPLHWLAKYPKFHERINVLPYHVTCVKNGMGLTAFDVAEKVRGSHEAEVFKSAVLASTEVVAALPMNYKLDLSDANLADFKVGFEFEFISGMPHEHIAELLHLAGYKIGLVTDEYGVHQQHGYTAWHVTGDPTIEIEDEGQYQIELVSPPLEFSEIRDILSTVWGILRDTGATTNDSCGLHISISHKAKGFNTAAFNPIKLALFLGDDKIIRSMGREDNLNCQALLAYVRGVVHADLAKGVKHIIGPLESPALPEKMRDRNTNKPVPTDYDVTTVVDKIAHDPKTRLRLVNSFDKDVSINLTKMVPDNSGTVPLIEYRAGGNAWSAKSPLMFEGVARRFSAAAKVAMTPEEAYDTYRALIVRDILHGKTPSEQDGLDMNEIRNFISGT